MNESNEEPIVEEVNETEEEVQEEQTPETEEETESLEDKLARLEKENHTLKIQKGKIKAKAERTTAEPKSVELSQTDIIALVKSNVEEDDMERVTKFAQMEGITVKEALGNEDLKAILDRRSEARKVAEASNTGNANAGSTSATGEALLENAKSGKMPDANDLQKMWDAERRK